MNEKNIKKRAIERAQYALATQGGNFGVGFAEGVIEILNHFHISVWCAIALENNNLVYSSDNSLILPIELRQNYQKDKLTETDIETYVTIHSKQTYEYVVKKALEQMKNSGDR